MCSKHITNNKKIIPRSIQVKYYSTPWIVTNTTSDIIIQPVNDGEGNSDAGTIIGVIVTLILLGAVSAALFVYMR